MEPPVTTECAILREENEMLAAENRRLLNEINQLRRVPAYPVEEAVRAVWEHGRDFGYLSGSDGDRLTGGEWQRCADKVLELFAGILKKG